MTRLNGVEQRQRSVNLHPETWERFKRKCGTDGVSPAARLGRLVEADLNSTTPDAVWFPRGLSVGERRAIWHALEYVSRKMPLRTREALTYQQAVMQLRDRFADAFTPAKPTMLDPGVPAIKTERTTQ